MNPLFALIILHDLARVCRHESRIPAKSYREHSSFHTIQKGSFALLPTIRDLAQIGFPFLVGLLLVGCTSSPSTIPDEPAAEIVVTGVVKPLQVASWQYGSYLLVNRQSGQRYALTGQSVDLSEHVGSGPVTVRGNFVDGYPVDGGPPYIRVFSVTKP